MSRYGRGDRATSRADKGQGRERVLQPSQVDVRGLTTSLAQWLRRPLLLTLVAFGLGLVDQPATGHEIGLELKDLARGVAQLETTLSLYERRPPIPQQPKSPAQQRRALGEAEVEMALGHTDRALRILLGRLNDPAFRAMPEYVGALLLTAEVLERKGEFAGAMSLAKEAMERGQTPQHMAEAGARWFRLARLTRRFDDRLRLFELWRRKGGADAAGTEEAAQVMYEVGFALRADGRTAEARRLLAKVPSESAFGSRAAFLAGTLFVQDGDLENAERWFSAIKDWPLPALDEDHPQVAIERELRALSALSTGRLRYERGDLEAARLAYREVPRDSPHLREACWELAYLETEAKRRRAALKYVHCVETLGAPGAMSVDLDLFKSSLFAHVNRYAASIEAYQTVFDAVRRERDLVADTFRRITHPAEFLFAGMERTAVERGPDATPGPATLLGGAWTSDVDRAYRVDRGLGTSLDETDELASDLTDIRRRLDNPRGFEPLELRRLNLRRIVQEIDHLAGHAGEMEFAVRGEHDARSSHDHQADRTSIKKLVDRLALQRRRAVSQIEALSQEELARRNEALSAVASLRIDIESLREEALRLRQATKGPVNAAAQAALDDVLARLDDAAMRAEVGVLDTYWLKKQHRTRSIEALLNERDEVERQFDEALGAVEED